MFLRKQHWNAEVFFDFIVTEGIDSAEAGMFSFPYADHWISFEKQNQKQNFVCFFLISNLLAFEKSRALEGGVTVLRFLSHDKYEHRVCLLSVDSKTKQISACKELQVKMTTQVQERVPLRRIV